MIVFLVLVLVVLVGLVVALVLGRLGGRGEAMAAPTSTSPFEPLPEGRVDPDRVRDVRFDIGLRGYRMDQVDATLDRLVLELQRRGTRESWETLRGDPPRRPRPTPPPGAERHGSPHPRAHHPRHAGAALAGRDRLERLRALDAADDDAAR